MDPNPLQLFLDGLFPQVLPLPLQPGVHSVRPNGSRSGNVGSHQQRIVRSGEDRQHRHRPDVGAHEFGLSAGRALSDGVCRRHPRERLLPQALLGHRDGAHRRSGVDGHHGLQYARSD